MNINKNLHKNKIKLSTGDVIFNILNYFIFGLITLLCVFPFYYIAINTISDNHISELGNVMFYPKGIHFTNYMNVLKLKGLGHAAFISLARTVIGTFCTVFASAVLGYLFSKPDMWQRKFFYRLVVITMYLNAGLIPWFIMMMNLKLTNNFMAYILPAIVSPFNIILVKTFVESLPASLEESAKLDGAGIFRILLSIIIPLTKPILATIAIFSAVGQWNSFIDTVFLMTKQGNYTLQFILYRYLNESTSLAKLLQTSQGANIAKNIALAQTPTSVRMTVTMIVVLPVLMIYPIFQRYFVKGIMIGAVKG
jgi:putative aldouronate transport system permease protein